MSEAWSALIGDLDADEERELVHGISVPARTVTNRNWPTWAHTGQTEPSGDWSA